MSSFDFAATLSLHSLAANRFTTRAAHLPGARVFGGQLIAQCLIAAQQTVVDPFVVHSAHAYFINAGDIERPVEYRVRRVREGRRFANRFVEAWQGRRRLVMCQVSFQRPASGPEHSLTMPEVPSPEALLPIHPRVIERLEAVSGGTRELWLADPGWEFRAVEAFAPTVTSALPPRRHFWFKATGDHAADLPGRAALAFASDLHLLETALLPHEVRWPPIGLRGASLDHAIWFYREPQVDQWMLYSLDSPGAASSRFFARGSIHTRGGELVALSSQEGTFTLPGYAN